MALNYRIFLNITLVLVVLGMSSLHGQTAWSPVLGISEAFQSNAYQVSVKVETVGGEFVLASLDSRYYYSQDGPTFNVAELDLDTSIHFTSEFHFDNQHYFHHFYHDDFNLVDFILTASREIRFVASSPYGYGDFLGTATLPEQVDPILENIVGDDVTGSTFSIEALHNSLNSYYTHLDLSANHIVHGEGVYLMATGVPSEGNYHNYQFYDGEPCNLYYSTDLNSWTEVSIPVGVRITSLAYDNGKFAATGTFISNYNNFYYENNRVGVIMFSEDGLDWNTSLINSVDEVNSVIWDGMTWMASGSDGCVLRQIGNVWDVYPIGNVYDAVTSIAYGNGHIVACTEAGELYASKDLLAWHLQAQFSKPIESVLANDSHFVCFSGSGLYYSPFSPQGIADIVQQPEGEFVIPGEQVELRVVAVGDDTLIYQWYEGESGDVSNPIVGAVTPSLRTPQLYATTHYWVQVSNAIGIEKSMTATLTMQEQPVITDQPDNADVEIGRSHTIRVSTTGVNLTYQWFYGISGDTALPVHGATGNSISVRPSSTVDSDYWVRVSNDIGSLDSSTARISGLLIAPRIRSQPVDKTVYAGTYSSISISMEGYGLVYQWYNGQSGDTSEPLTQSNSSSFSLLPKEPGVYECWVRVSNAAGYVDSRTIKYEVLIMQAPVISKSPLSVSAYVGSSVSLNVTSHGNDRNYQWYAGKSGNVSLPLIATGSSFSPSTLFAGTTPYWVRVYNATGHVDSETTFVTVSATDFTLIEKQPLDFSAYKGSGTSYSNLLIEMRNPENVVSYQWYHGTSGDTSTPILGAVQATYSPDLSVVGNFGYWVRINTVTGIVDSRTALVTILPLQLRITEQPVNKSTLVNDFSSISVRAYGDSLSYQWYVGESGDVSSPLTNANGSSYSPPYATVGEFTYWVRVTSGLESVDSRTVTFTVLASLPHISTHPVDKEVTFGSSSSLHVSVYRSTNVTYQWYKGISGDVSQPVVDASSSSLSLSSPDLGLGVHQFWVRVSNVVGYVDSEVGIITVHPANFEQWATAYGLSIHIAEGNESYSGDQIPDLLKYVMGLDPSTYFEGPVLEYGVLEGAFADYFTIQFRMERDLKDVDVRVEESIDLVNWAATTVNIGPTHDNEDGTSEYRYRASHPIDSGPRFMRIHVEQTL